MVCVPIVLAILKLFDNGSDYLLGCRVKQLKVGIFDYKGTLGFLVYREGNVDTLVTNDISISHLGIEILRSEKQSKLTSCRPFLFSMSP